MVSLKLNHRNEYSYEYSLQLSKTSASLRDSNRSRFRVNRFSELANSNGKVCLSHVSISKELSVEVTKALFYQKHRKNFLNSC